jgi:hypothetical protein
MSLYRASDKAVTVWRLLWTRVVTTVLGGASGKHKVLCTLDVTKHDRNTHVSHRHKGGVADGKAPGFYVLDAGWRCMATEMVWQFCSGGERCHRYKQCRWLREVLRVVQGLGTKIRFHDARKQEAQPSRFL